MNRLLTRLLIIGLFAGLGWASYQLADVTDCSGPRSDAWADSTLARLEAAEQDYASWGDDTTLAQFASLAVRAEARHQAQLAEGTISCLENLQEHTVEFFFYEWKMYEAAGKGDFFQAAAFDEDSIAANEAMRRELETMASEYDWDLE